MSLFRGIQFSAKNGRHLWQGIPVSVVAAGVIAMLPGPLRGGEPKAMPAQVDPVVATINNEKVPAAEYRLIMERKTADVFSYFKEHKDLDDHVGYWSESSGPEGPLARLRQVVLEELIRIKVHQSLAKEKGLIKETSFANFKEEFERENVRRAAAKSAGQVIYGPSQYRIGTYYYILFGDLAYKLKQAIAKELEPEIPESEIKSYYEANKDSLGGKSLDDMRRKILVFLSTKAAEKKLDALCASAKVEVNEPLLRPLVPRSD